jgi:orotate phosphoribosyltransferase
VVADQLRPSQYRKAPRRPPGSGYQPGAALTPEESRSPVVHPAGPKAADQRLSPGRTICGRYSAAMSAPDDRAQLIGLVKDLAVVHGEVTLSSGRTADYYVDMRRVTLDGAAAPLVGRVMRRLVSDWQVDAVGGLTLGADPVAAAMLHAAAAEGQRLDAFVVRKEQKQHGLQRKIEGSPVEGRRVLAVEDTSTTGGSVLTAVEALREAGADVVGVAVIVDRDTGARENVEAAGLPYRYAIDAVDLGLVERT